MANPPKQYFSKVREAREALKAKSMDLYELHWKIINEAISAGDLETASVHTIWLSEHMPLEDGVSMFDPSIDKAKKDEGPKGPTIKIGIALGGVTPQKALPPAQVIEVEEVDD